MIKYLHDLYRVSPSTNSCSLISNKWCFRWCIIEMFITSFLASVGGNAKIVGVLIRHTAITFVRPSIRTFVSFLHSRYLSFYWKEWFDIYHAAFSWLVQCLPFIMHTFMYFLLPMVQICNWNFRDIHVHLVFLLKYWICCFYMMAFYHVSLFSGALLINFLFIDRLNVLRWSNLEIFVTNFVASIERNA